MLIGSALSTGFAGCGPEPAGPGEMTEDLLVSGTLSTWSLDGGVLPVDPAIQWAFNRDPIPGTSIAPPCSTSTDLATGEQRRTAFNTKTYICKLPTATKTGQTTSYQIVGWGNLNEVSRPVLSGANDSILTWTPQSNVCGYRCGQAPRIEIRAKYSDGGAVRYSTPFTMKFSVYAHLNKSWPTKLGSWLKESNVDDPVDRMFSWIIFDSSQSDAFLDNGNTIGNRPVYLSFSSRNVEHFKEVLTAHDGKIAGAVWDYENVLTGNDCRAGMGGSPSRAEADLTAMYAHAHALGIPFGVIVHMNPINSLGTNCVDYAKAYGFADFVMPMTYCQGFDAFLDRNGRPMGGCSTKVPMFGAKLQAQNQALGNTGATRRVGVVTLLNLLVTDAEPDLPMLASQIKPGYVDQMKNATTTMPPVGFGVYNAQLLKRELQCTGPAAPAIVTSNGGTLVSTCNQDYLTNDTSNSAQDGLQGLSQ